MGYDFDPPGSGMIIMTILSIPEQSPIITEDQVPYIIYNVLRTHFI